MNSFSPHTVHAEREERRGHKYPDKLVVWPEIMNMNNVNSLC